MKKNSTYKKLGAYHKARYRFYRVVQRLAGVSAFPSEYWEPECADPSELMRKLGYKLTKMGWVKR